MHNVLMILRREYLQRVTKKSFWIGTLVIPALMLGFAFLPILLIRLQPGEQKKVALVDPSGKIAAPLQETLKSSVLKDGRPEYVVVTEPADGGIDAARARLEPQVTDGKLFGVITVGDDLFAKDAFRLYARNVGNIIVTETLAHALKSAVVGLRLERSNLAVDRATLDKIMGPVDLETFQVSAQGGAKKSGFQQAYFGTFAFVMILYMSLLLYGIQMMRGVLEEKTSRVMEVLLGSVSPQELIVGKILGIGLVGLTQIAVYALTAGVARVYLASSASGGNAMEFFSGFTATKLAYFVVYFVLGYFLFVSFFAAVGAVCNSEEEAQNLQSPVIMLLVVPMASTFFFVGNPDSTLAVVVSLIPLFTPLVMYMRIAVLTPPLWQIALSIALTAATIYVLFRGVSKVFRIGVLMYGKRPTIPEILRWARS